MQQVPLWWIIVSEIYFILSILWTIGLTIGVLVMYREAMPLIKEARVQIRRVSGQARNIAVKASSTAEIVHAQTQNLLGNANSAGTLVTRQARTMGAALTGLLVAAKVMNFVRKMI